MTVGDLKAILDALPDDVLVVTPDLDETACETGFYSNAETEVLTGKLPYAPGRALLLVVR